MTTITMTTITNNNNNTLELSLDVSKMNEPECGSDDGRSMNLTCLGWYVYHRFTHGHVLLVL